MACFLVFVNQAARIVTNVLLVDVQVTDELLELLMLHFVLVLFL